jgi:hypothetical protein
MGLLKWLRDEVARLRSRSGDWSLWGDITEIDPFDPGNVVVVSGNDEESEHLQAVLDTERCACGGRYALLFHVSRPVEEDPDLECYSMTGGYCTGCGRGRWFIYRHPWPERQQRTGT